MEASLVAGDKTNLVDCQKQNTCNRSQFIGRSARAKISGNAGKQSPFLPQH